MVTRREFLAWGVASGAVAAAGAIVPVSLLVRRERTGAARPSAGSVVPALVTRYPMVRVTSLSGLDVGDVVDFTYPTEQSQASLFRLGRPAAGGIGPEQDIVAFGTDCTHMGCPLRGEYQPEHGVLGPCGCHFTTFDLTHRGQVVIGQATQNLPQILLDIEGDDIVALGTIGILYGFRDNLEDAPIVEGL